MAPGIAFAQAIGRWGNWFNQELYGRATDLPWALKIDSAHRPADSLDAATYHPTFLYESLWCVGVALLVIWADRRFKLGHGRAFALYVAAYTVGRFWIEYLRVDDAHHVLGLRLNDWTSILVFAAAVVYMVVSAKLRPGREEVVEPAALAPAGASAKDTDPDAKDADAKGADAEDADEKAADGDGEKTGAGEAEPDTDEEDGAAVPVEAEAKPAKNL